MTNNQNVETVTSKSDIALVTLAVLCAIAGVVAFALLTEQPLSIRLASLGGGLVLGVLLAWVSPSGKRLLAYGRQSYEELRRVVWPTKKETLNTTGLVMAFVVVMAFFLFVVDKLIELGLYDGLLRLSL
ncbi:preprotein translocase subunit SecE [Sutterella megalosphaeroides]|uniref:Protein translocase subunit SecE n=1 Tax=Sutterella megalosphaeroides TaxID=2494234 RepID=A0A2Z6I7F1_9BURK|nr:preprotein translocase subunit SecE [Sutterella megalosphaeroides]BBF22385.1 protein translocase subunit SecE [Sutterella megalosphaeroides]